MEWSSEKTNIVSENKVPCEKLQTCSFFLRFHDNAEVVKNLWIQMFCASQERSSNCARKKIFQQTGKSPSAEMTPNGTILKI